MRRDDLRTKTYMLIAKVAKRKRYIRTVEVVIPSARRGTLKRGMSPNVNAERRAAV